MKIIFESKQEKEEFIDNISVCPSAIGLTDKRATCPSNCKQCWKESIEEATNIVVLYDYKKIKTFADALAGVDGILYFVDRNGQEIEDCMPNEKVLSVRHIGNEEYEITIDL